MPTLEELLRASLKGANERFDSAKNTLHAAVVEAAKAVEAATGGKATIRLEEVSKKEAETRYSLEVIMKGTDEVRELEIFSVSSNGFPIRALAEGGGAYNQFNTEESIVKYFEKLASNPESPLVRYLAFIIRNSDEPIPF